MTDKFLARRAVLNRHEADHADDAYEKRRASLTLGGKARGTTKHAVDKAELLRWLDMLGLPPCERPLQSARKWNGKR